MPLLAELFTFVDKYDKLPRSWIQALVVPIYKKGDRNIPSNYRPVRLLAVMGKLYAYYLLDKLKLWIAGSNILGLEQARFRPCKSGTEHCLVLSHLISKRVLHYKAHLYAAFLNLRAAFDLVDRTLLWKKLDDMGLDKKILHLIGTLHSQTSLSIKVSPLSHVSVPIPTHIGVKQGCVLHLHYTYTCPTLFNLFINDLALILL